MANGNLVVTWPGGIGNPIGEHIPTSGGRRRRSTRRRKNTRKNRKNTRRNTRRRA
jgi:hypothetical protein